MDVAEQEKLLRPFCRKFPHIALINPYLASGEFDFTEAVVRLAGDRASTTIDLHAQPHPDNLDMESVERGLRYRLQGAARHACVRIFFWEWSLFHDRYLLAGRTVPSGSAGQVFSPLKGVSLSHVARNSDVDSEPTIWQLLTDRKTGDVYRRRYGEDAAPLRRTVLFEARG
jgi:hypothetical protein